MFSLNGLMEILEKHAPLFLSNKMIEKGSYDNSGVIIKNHENANKILFSLDLSVKAVERAKELGCDTIVTHHPAIYTPIKEIGVSTETKDISQAVKEGLNVVSMHLNLDIADDGIDENLVKALGGETEKILDLATEKQGYGRVFSIDQDIAKYVDNIKQKLNCDKIIYYGQGRVKKVASFCGGGASCALEIIKNNTVEIDTIVTSDASHHHVKGIVEQDKNLILIPHYVAEEYGFNKFYTNVKKDLEEKATVYYFQDKRFV